MPTSYRIIKKLGEGTFGDVYMAQSSSGNLVAIKHISIRERDILAQTFPLRLLREILALLHLRGEMYIMQLLDFFVHGASVVLVTDLYQTDLHLAMQFQAKSLAKKPRKTLFPEAVVKKILQMLLFGIHACHSRHILHRVSFFCGHHFSFNRFFQDIKPSNLLFSSQGRLAICDFGQARLDDHTGLYDPQVATRWYRAPELLFGAHDYSAGVDLWAIGCILAQLLRNGQPLFQGSNDIDQLNQIFKVLGTPCPESWPATFYSYYYNKVIFRSLKRRGLKPFFDHVSSEALDLVDQLLALRSEDRISALGALEHDWFRAGPKPAPLEQVALWFPPAPNSKTTLDRVPPRLQGGRFVV